MHILIVEDEDIISEGIFEYLTERNYTCTIAKDTFKNIINSFSMQINRRVNQGTARGARKY